jgi:murein DD-endopeptidase MepM/ murein hydrolase activator NlpD
MIEPERLAILQLGSFLALSISWQIPSPSHAANQPLFSPPVVGSSVINHYRQSETPYGPGHRGVDYKVVLAQGVFAPADATVHFVGKVVNRQLISLSHDDQLLSSFEPVCSLLTEGESVQQGQLIGEVCEGDRTYQSHCESLSCLHFSIRNNGEYLSPLWFTGQLENSRLLPWVDPDSLEARP